MTAASTDRPENYVGECPDCGAALVLHCPPTKFCSWAMCSSSSCRITIDLVRKRGHNGRSTRFDTG